MRRLAAGLLTVVFLLFPDLAEAQDRFNLTGTVVDSAGVGLQGATVVALTQPDSVISKFAITDGKGAFTLRRVPRGSYVLQVTFVGFQTSSQDLEITADTDVGTITLNEAIGELGELIVSSDYVPMVMKKDTLEFNARAFGTRPNATVEDLLRRLPGVEVQDDGSIKAQGKDVQNVLVDGKEFFGSDPTIATKNLPADAVNKVQVYDKQSDMAEFTGVDDGEEEKTINLELTDDAKKGMFGNITGGLGDTERYDAQANINRFSPDTQLALIANINNVNRQGFSFQDYMSFMGGLQAFTIDGMASGVQLGSDLSQGFSETLSIGLNASREFDNGLSVRSSYFLSSLDNRQDRTVQQQQLLGSSVSSRVSDLSNQDSGNLTHKANLNVDKKISDGHDLRFRSNLNISNSTLTNSGFRRTLTSTGLTQNTSQTLYDSNGDRTSGDARLTWRKRLNENGTSLVAEGNLNLNDSDTGANLANSIGFYEAGDVVSYDEILQEQQSLGTTFSQRQQLSLTQPLGGQRVMVLSAERRENTEDQSKNVFDSAGGVLTLNDALSSGFDRTYTYYLGGLKFSQNRDRVRLGLGLQVQDSQLDGIIADRDETVSSGFTHLLPSANLGIEIRQGMNFDARYNTSTREPSMNELQPFVDNTDPLNIYVGNPNLTPEYRHMLNLHYMFYDQFSFINFFTYVSLVYTDNKIVRSRTIDDQFRQSVTSVNSNGSDWNLNGRADYGMPIRPLRAKINLSNSAMLSRGIEFVNSAENQTRILRNTAEIRLENRSKDIWDLRGGTRFTYNNVDYSLNPALNQSYVNKTLFGEVSWYLNDSWEVSTKLNYRMFDKDVFGSSQNVAIWEASISKTLWQQRAEVQLVGLDLLDQNVGINFSNSPTYIQEERIQSLGRYVMFKFIYHLSAVGRRDRGMTIEMHGD